MDIEEITMNYEDEEGKLVVKELDKFILSKGAWSTIMFLYQNLNKRTGEYSEPMVRIARYKKSGDFYRLQSKFNISSKAQALKIISKLQEWYKE